MVVAGVVVVAVAAVVVVLLVVVGLEGVGGGVGWVWGGVEVTRDWGCVGWGWDEVGRDHRAY